MYLGKFGITKKTLSMTSFKQKDVVLADILFADGTKSKKRPALIISNDKYHLSRKEILVCAITSNTERTLFGDTKIKSWKEAGLKYPSSVLAVIQTIQVPTISHKLGELSEGDFKIVLSNFGKTME